VAAVGVAAALLTSAAVGLLSAGTATAVRPRAQVSALAAIPARYLTWYKRAARTCPGLSWEVLAGIGTMESDNGRSTARGVHQGRNPQGAEGPMQFEPATFAEYAVRADRARKLSPYDPKDAIFTAARMLCADGARGGSLTGLRGAIFAYDHARWYVRDVLAIAARYTAAAARLARQQRAGPAPPRRHLTGLGGT
jgi:membrane-bound lytic murein transglycosylase B